MQAQFSISLIIAWMCIQCLAGCSTPRTAITESRSSIATQGPPEENLHTFASPPSATLKLTTEKSIRQVTFDEGEALDSQGLDKQQPDDESRIVAEQVSSAPMARAGSELNFLLDAAVDGNPRLIRLYREYQAASARSQHVDKLPDPKLGANLFGNPIETASGSQRANMNLSQTIPWLERLSAQQQQACFEALAIRAEYAAERLRVIAGVKVGWYRLYVIDKQIETTAANQELLESLIDVANARIATGKASQGDVLLGTLELSTLEERLLTYRKQRRAVEAEINRLIGRSASLPIGPVEEIPGGMIEMDADSIHQIALKSQPEIDAARLRTQATRWGIEVARLSRRPELMLSASYFFTDDNRPATAVVDVGEDPWAVGVQVSLPIWREKYDAVQNEAGWKHQAAQSSVVELADRYDALILDLVTEAERAAETAQLYATTILPQARQTLSADQESYSNGSVEFDRVIRDYRNLLTLELGYQQAIGELAMANARIQQAAGRDLPVSPALESSPHR